MTTNPADTDLYRNEQTATAIAAAELINNNEFDLASYIVESTDSETLLEGFTNALALAVQLIASDRDIPENEVFNLLRAANEQLINSSPNSNLDEAIQGL